MISIYSYSSTYWYQARGYARKNYLPSFNGEQHFESEINGEISGDTEMGTPYVLRKQEYWTLLSGGCGQLYGNHYIWPFISGWQNNLNTVGVQQLQYNSALFTAREWWSLVPDTNHTVLTGGYGTYATNGLISTNDYATAASTPDGALAMVYVPTNRTLTVNLAKLKAAATARWYDPTSGGYTAITGSPFANTGTHNFTSPGINGAGDEDWVLVLETNVPAVAILPASIQQNYVAPQTPQTEITAVYPAAQNAGDANIVAIGWNNSITSISTVTDSSGNKYQAANATYRGNGLSHAIYYAMSIKGGSNTVTVKFKTGAALASLYVSEYSGLNQSGAFSGGSSATGKGPSASVGSIKTTGTNELIFCAGYSTNNFMLSGAGFTPRIIASPGGGMVEDAVAAAPGAYLGTATPKFQRLG